MGGGAWDHDRDAGALVSGAEHVQAHDGSIGLRRRWKSGSTSTHGKRPEEAKALELKGWHYPRHLAGRTFLIVVHGDTEGAESVRRALHDWLSDMKLFPAGEGAVLDRYVGYYKRPVTKSWIASKYFSRKHVTPLASWLKRSGACGPAFVPPITTWRTRGPSKTRRRL